MHWKLYLSLAVNTPESHRESAPGTWNPNREHLFIPGRKHIQKPVVHTVCDQLPWRKLSSLPPSGRGEWPRRQEGPKGSERAPNAFTL